jgi:two-component system response regulator DevR
MLTSFADDEALFASIMAGAAGYVLKQIKGEELGLAEKTVKNYVPSILAKLEVARRAEAAAYLARHTTLPGT